MCKIKIALWTPGYGMYVFFTKYLGLSLRQRVFAHAEKYRSDSENGHYASGVLHALKSQKNFQNFKRSYSYRQILEHGDKVSGAQYLSIVAARENDILQTSLETVLIDDDVRNPISTGTGIMVSTFPNYLEICEDCFRSGNVFGSNLGVVREIGCGYGGQALVNDQVLNVERAILYDLPL